MKIRQIIFLGIILAFVISACFPTPESTTEIKITTPTEGEKIDQIETIKGSSQGIPKGSVAWIVVFLPATGRYYPQNHPADVQANGDWSSVAYVGQTGESGLKADIIAVLANKATQDAIKNYLKDAIDKNDFPGLERLPKEATIYHRISVSRK